MKKTLCKIALPALLLMPVAAFAAENEKPFSVSFGISSISIDSEADAYCSCGGNPQQQHAENSMDGDGYYIDGVYNPASKFFGQVNISSHDIDSFSGTNGAGNTTVDLFKINGGVKFGEMFVVTGGFNEMETSNAGGTGTYDVLTIGGGFAKNGFLALLSMGAGTATQTGTGDGDVIYTGLQLRYAADLFKGLGMSVAYNWDYYDSSSEGNGIELDQTNDVSSLQLGVAYQF